MSDQTGYLYNRKCGCGGCRYGGSGEHIPPACNLAADLPYAFASQHAAQPAPVVTPTPTPEEGLVERLEQAAEVLREHAQVLRAGEDISFTPDAFHQFAGLIRQAAQRLRTAERTPPPFTTWPVVCIACEGVGVKRTYLNRAGEYDKKHCAACGGTGKTPTAAPPRTGGEE